MLLSEVFTAALTRDKAQTVNALAALQPADRERVLAAAWLVIGAAELAGTSPPAGMSFSAGPTDAQMTASLDRLLGKPARFTFTYRDPDGALFAPGAFDKTLGTVAPWTFKRAEDSPALAMLGGLRLVAAKVSDDRRAVELTVEEVPGDEH